MIKRILTLMIAVMVAAGLFATKLQVKGVVSENGRLRVEGTKLVNAKGEPVQLRGVSFGWHNMWPRFFNEGSVTRLARDWGADIVRCSIGLDLDSLTYDKNPELAYECVDRVMRGAVQNDCYVLVDFHSHANNLPLAKKFFEDVTKKYGHLPNVLYEIWNEPTEVPWQETKEYSEELIPLIRANAPESVIIVPTPRWDQEVDKAADDPITKFDNLMYSLHYYAATHKDHFRDKAKYALSKGLPIFMSECAAMEHTGDGVIDPASWDEWMQLADEHDISWICWSLSDKVETCSMLRPGAPSDGRDWRDEDLKPWSVMVKHYLKRGRNDKIVDKKGFVTVDNGQFKIDGKPYRFVGTNLWYGGILGSEGEGGDMDRLIRELDTLKSLGIDNVRVLVGGEGREGLASHISPVLQKAPGVYDEQLLAGLDRLLAELEKREMKAVLYLGNAWEWSGGYGAYLEWAGAGRCPVPSEAGYDKYMEFVSQFVANDKAKELYADHVRNMVTRTNSITGKPYSESPAIMAWQIANEPRAFSDAGKEKFAEWTISVAELIKRHDPNHLVSLGSEGKHGCEQDMQLWKRIHQSPAIDYGTLHLWPYNWGWVNEKNLAKKVPQALAKAKQYINEHGEVSKELGKPLVLEEFGYPRDGFKFGKDAKTKGRDAFYEGVFSMVATDQVLQGCNFWGWGGECTPSHETWQPGDQYSGDPAQEAQGLNSVFSTDSSTLEVIKKSCKTML